MPIEKFSPKLKEAFSADTGLGEEIKNEGYRPAPAVAAPVARPPAMEKKHV